MADKITESTILAVGLKWHDNEKDADKITYIKLPNPRSNLTEQQIKTAVQTLLSGEEPILWDANGDSFDSTTAVFTAYTENVRNYDFDIGIES